MDTKNYSAYASESTWVKNTGTEEWSTLLHRALLTSFLCKVKQLLTLKALDM